MCAAASWRVGRVVGRAKIVFLFPITKRNKTYSGNPKGLKFSFWLSISSGLEAD